MANTKNTNSKNSDKTSEKKSPRAAKSPEKEKIRQSAAEKQAALYKKKLIHDEIMAFVIIVVGIILLVMSIKPESSGILGALVNKVLFGLFGKAAYAIPYFMILFGALVFTRRLAFITVRSGIAVTMLFVSIASMFSVNLADGASKAGEAVALGFTTGKGAGGLFGSLFAYLMLQAFGKIVLYLICAALIVIALLFIINSPISAGLDNAKIKHAAYKKAKEEQRQALLEAEEQYRAEQEEKAANFVPETGKQIGMPFGLMSKKDAEDKKKKENILTLAASENFDKKEEEPQPQEQEGEDAPKSEIDAFFDAKKAERAKAEALKEEEKAEAAPQEPEEEPEKAARDIEIRWDIPAEEEPPAEVEELPKEAAPQSKIPEEPERKIEYVPEPYISSNQKKILGYVNDESLFGRDHKIEGFGLNAEKPASALQTMLQDDFVNQPEEPQIPVTENTSAILERLAAEPEKEDPWNIQAPAEEPEPETAPVDIDPMPAEGFGDEPEEDLPEEEDDDASAFDFQPARPAAAPVQSRPSFRLSGSQTYQPPVRQEAPQAPGHALHKPAEPAAQTQPQTPPVPKDKPYEFPPIELLNKPAPQINYNPESDLRSQADILEKTLASFGVSAKVVDMIKGPAVTRFEVQPATGVKVSRITSLQDDLALNLRAKSLRIEAPIPGKAAVGIEISNETIASVYLREILEADAFKRAKSRISVGLGKSVAGTPVVADLKKMPHLLVAGATGSGKSVCINSILISLLYKAKPDEVKLLLVDPKVVELSNYNGIPHLMVPVVTEPAKAAAALGWAVAEMNDRYNKFAEKSVRDLQSYNEAVTADGEEDEKMPQIVIIIDELADLIMASKNQVEDYICRLAQKARAAGMHLIIATQRPSADIITGVIKANVPSRIAFKVSSQIDSRVILDMGGAEKLLGRGDMLYGPQDLSKPERVQGCFVSDEEVNSVIDFVKTHNGKAEYSESVTSAMDKVGAGPAAASDDEEDEMLGEAIEAVIRAEAASVSSLQRRFRIGYNRAARLIDMMEERGIVGPADGGRPRKVLMTLAEYEGRYTAGNDPVDEEITAYTPF